jgi:hypothetical protein
MTKINYTDNKKILKSFYDQNGLTANFEKDNKYLETAFKDITKIWLDNLNQIKTVKYLMIAEAPLWGQVKKYIYNSETNNSQFFYRSDLAEILNRNIIDKADFIKVCNEIGLLVVDISPFPLNTKDTAINYRELSTNQYRQLVSQTIPTFFDLKIKAIKAKQSKSIKTFFRYARVKNNFQDLISKVLIDNNIIKSENEIGDISQNGGGVDKTKLRQILTSK